MSNPTQRNFNGTTFTLGGTTQGFITGLTVNRGGAKIDVYQPGDLLRLFELGIPVASISISLRGIGTQPTLGASGAPAVALGNGNTLTIPGTDWQTMSVNFSGREDGAWEGTAEYGPCPSTTT